jgi:Divergent InlB B-repeat domain
MQRHWADSSIFVVTIVAAILASSLATIATQTSVAQSPRAVGSIVPSEGTAAPSARFAATGLPSPPSAAGSETDLALTPASVSVLGNSWQGLNSTSSCSGKCLPADPDVAAGGGYVFEVANTAYRIWTTNGALVLNASLGTLFGTGGDTLLAPQVHYDPTTLRWFASAEDVSRNQIFYGGSLSSDPTSTWNIQHFNPPGGDIPTQPLLAVNSLNVVVTTNLYRGTSFRGAEVWAANKTQLLGGGGVNTWSSAAIPTNESLVPAQPSGLSSGLFLVSDGTGGSALDLFTLNGSPPGTPTFSLTVAFPSVTAWPLNASQRGTPNLVNTGSAQVENAVWQAGTLWAVAAVKCTPVGDSSPRSCLHLWELSTQTDTMHQNFNWSTGAGTYDYYPALSVGSAGDLAVAFEESSTTTYPAVLVTAQSIADSPGTLEPALTVKAGAGPDNVTGMCPLGVCPFGNYSGAAVLPITTGDFFVAGEYTAADYATNPWHTWVREVSVSEAYRVNFTETNLPSGTSWSVTVNGVVASSSSPTITVNETNGAYTFTVLSPISGGAGAQYVATPSSGTYSVASAPVSVAITYTIQFELTTTVAPAGAGSVYPSGGWFNESASVNLSALAGAGHAFADWVGSGAGSYSGTSNPATVTMSSPLTEQAQFSTLVTFLVTFTESGLPTGTSWTVVLNGLSNASTTAALTFNEPNGSYSFFTGSVVSGSSGTRYVASPTTGTFHLSGAVITESISYVTQFELSTSISPAGAGSVFPSTGWFNASSYANLSALAGGGHAFSSWAGSGSGSYSGPSNPAPVHMLGPVTEEALFSTVVTFAVTFTETGLPQGSSWKVTLNGVENSSTGASLTFNEPNGSYSFVTDGVIPGAVGTQYVSNPSSGSFDLSGTSVGETIAYLTQFELIISVTPSNTGSVSPDHGWFDAGSVVNLSAIAGTGYQFVGWQGSGPGNYTGPRDPASVTIGGPVSEVARFEGASTSGTSPSSSSSGTAPLWAYVASLIAAAALAAVVALLFAERKRSPPSREPPRPVSPPVPSGAVAESPSAPESPPWQED